MKKAKSSFINMFLTLLVVCALAGAALAAVYQATSAPIQQARDNKQEEAIKQVLPPFDELKTEKKADYNPIRPAMHAFREMSIAEKNAVIAKDPAYGRVICRCETVTEGEILAAIRQNPKPRDLDGVKRRTRAQMGRCQGGFCSPYIVELLATELNIPYEKVTKSGGNSLVNLEKTKGAR